MYNCSSCVNTKLSIFQLCLLRICQFQQNQKYILHFHAVHFSVKYILVFSKFSLNNCKAHIITKRYSPLRLSPRNVVCITFCLLNFFISFRDKYLYFRYMMRTFKIAALFITIYTVHVFRENTFKSTS